MTQEATVTKILSSGKAEIEVKRQTACGGSCGACGGCAFKNIVTAVAVNSARASVGDRVSVEAGTKRILGAAALVYLVPLITFLLGYGIAAAVNAGESMSILLSLSCFFLGIAVVIPVNKRFKNRVSFEIVRVIG